jgi:hypothetical protein
MVSTIEGKDVPMTEETVFEVQIELEAKIALDGGETGLPQLPLPRWGR